MTAAPTRPTRRASGGNAGEHPLRGRQAHASVGRPPHHAVGAAAVAAALGFDEEHVAQLGVRASGSANRRAGRHCRRRRSRGRARRAPTARRIPAARASAVSRAARSRSPPSRTCLDQRHDQTPPPRPATSRRRRARPAPGSRRSAGRRSTTSGGRRRAFRRSSARAGMPARSRQVDHAGQLELVGQGKGHDGEIAYRTVGFVSGQLLGGDAVPPGCRRGGRRARRPRRAARSTRDRWSETRATTCPRGRATGNRGRRRAPPA